MVKMSGAAEIVPRSATHDVSRTSYHVKHIGQFAKRLEDSASRAFPNRGRTSQRYTKVQALLLHWGSDDLFVLPELEDLERCLREDYFFGTDIFAIPSENSHLELMMRVGQLIKEHENPDTLFIVYYGGHARIDESRQSTWCATRDADSSWLQWSAIQTLLERSKSDVLILLDCCAGAASATFPTGNSITETISASSWDAIAPDPGRYSFTNALIEVLQEWRVRTFSAAMLHAEVLARLKHPRPININGKHFEARSTPVHFMMTSNHKAPSIELCRTLPADTLPPSTSEASPLVDGLDIAQNTNPVNLVPDGLMSKEPNEDTPHVMISLALEEDQRLDINAWEQWISAFPAMAKYVKVQGVFKSHSTLLLVSMPVMIWDMLPEDPATSFVAFIRSNNLANQQRQTTPGRVPVHVKSAHQEANKPDTASFMSGVSGTTFAGTENTVINQYRGSSSSQNFSRDSNAHMNALNNFSPVRPHASSPRHEPQFLPTPPENILSRPMQPVDSHLPLSSPHRNQASSLLQTKNTISRRIILNQQQSQRRTTLSDDVPEPKRFAPHIEKRLEEYYQHESHPSDAQRAFFASNLGVDTFHLEVWFHHRRVRDQVATRFATMKIDDIPQAHGDGPRMLLPANLSQLLEISLPMDVLLLDMRPNSEYQKSHIYGALNLRAPKSFLEVASLEMIERVFTDEQSRTTFTRWNSARCIVFYSKGMEAPWECPAADSMLHKMRTKGWLGRCFILKGHYREFSTTFDKFIVGVKMNQGAGEWVKRQQTKIAVPVDQITNQEQYAAWLSHLEIEDRFRPSATSPARTSERTWSMEINEKELETEFQAQHRDLYAKAIEVGGKKPSTSPAAEAQMVEYLDRGLSKIRNSPTAEPPTTLYEPGYSKLGQEPSACVERVYLDRDVADEYVEISRTDGTGGAEARPTMAPKASSEPRLQTEDILRKGRGGNILSKVFRRS
ncbi:hypothetical protein HJFPF1_03532 [Paramyrothecium foliicola]|nr:hypothetical protein HJFPF1_03532 [Paramyrothecium foliicola]